MTASTGLAIFKRSAVIPVTTGALLSVCLTLVACIWEWVEAPFGVYQTTSGIAWAFVYDTAVSWLVPSFFALSVMVFLLHAGWHVFPALYRTHNQRKVERT